MISSVRQRFVVEEVDKYLVVSSSRLGEKVRLAADRRHSMYRTVACVSYK